MYLGNAARVIFASYPKQVLCILSADPTPSSAPRGAWCVERFDTRFEAPGLRCSGRGSDWSSRYLAALLSELQAGESG